MRTLLLPILLSLSATLAAAQPQAAVLLRIYSSLEVPAGSDGEFYTAGAAGGLSALVYPGSQQIAYLGGDLGYAYLPSQVPGVSVSRVSGGARAGFALEVVRGIRVGLFGRSGYYYGFLNDGSETAANPYLGGGLTLGYEATRAIAVDMQVGYDSYLDLQNTWTVSVGAVFKLAAPIEGRPPAPPSVSLRAAPALEIPAGRDSDLYTTGGGLELSAAIRSPEMPLLYLTGELGYGFLPTQAGPSLSRVTLGSGVGVSLGVAASLSLDTFAKAGYYYGLLNDGSGQGGGSPFIAAGAGLSYALQGPWALGLEGSYRRCLDLEDSWVVSLGVSRALAPAGGGSPTRPRPLALLPAAGDRGVASFDVRLAPTLELPVGQDRALYNFLGGLNISGVVTNPSFPFLYAEAGLGYGYALTAADLTLSRVTLGASLGVDLGLTADLKLDVHTGAGYYAGIMNDGSGDAGGNLFVLSGAGLKLRLSPSWRLGLDASYGRYPDLFDSWAVSLGSEHRLAAGVAAPDSLPPGTLERRFQRGRGLEISGVSFEEIFPVFYKYYDDHPVGKITVHNWETAPAENLRVSFLARQYMDNPKVREEPGRVPPGESRQIEIYGLFTDAVLAISEGTKISTQVTVSSSLRGRERSTQRIESMRIQGRNAMTWDDDRKASAFVTAKDPAVLRFAKAAAGLAREKGRGVDANLLVAMNMHTALRLYGMKYVVDPSSPYAQISNSDSTVDFLQFPKQTLQYKAGDCDDLSILYSALLESVGIETAFITIPGHIYLAFALTQGPEEARRGYARPDDLIFEKGKAWLPVEVTEIAGGFLSAWDIGAREWRENQTGGKAALYSVHEGWRSYEPTGYPGEVEISLPADAQVATAFAAELARFVDREISPQAARLQADIRASNGSPSAVNKLGVLYARFALDEQAEKQFQLAVRQTEFAPALINLGNLAFMRKDLKSALGYYERARRQSPENAGVLLGIARINHELENYGSAREAFARVKQLAPAMAERFSYLDLRGEEAARAAETNQTKGVVLWEE